MAPMRLLPFVALTVLAIASLPALAHPPGNGEIGFDVGWSDLDSDLADEGGGRVAFRGGFHFTKVFQVEGQLFHIGADEIASDLDPSSDDLALDAAMMNFVLGVPHAPDRRVAPYLLFGVGRANAEYDPGFFESGRDDTGMAWQMAIGSRFFFSPGGRAALRIEVSRLREDSFSFWKTHHSVTAGLTWRLGG